MVYFFVEIYIIISIVEIPFTCFSRVSFVVFIHLAAAAKSVQLRCSSCILLNRSVQMVRIFSLYLIN